MTRRTRERERERAAGAVDLMIIESCSELNSRGRDLFLALRVVNFRNIFRRVFFSPSPPELFTRTRAWQSKLKFSLIVKRPALGIILKTDSAD